MQSPYNKNPIIRAFCIALPVLWAFTLVESSGKGTNAESFAEGNNAIACLGRYFLHSNEDGGYLSPWLLSNMHIPKNTRDNLGIFGGSFAMSWPSTKLRHLGAALAHSEAQTLQLAYLPSVLTC